MFNSYVSLPEGIPILRPGHTKGPKGLATSFSLPIRQIWDFPSIPDGSRLHSPRPPAEPAAPTWGKLMGKRGERSIE